MPLDFWARGRGVGLDFIRPGRPMEIGFVERFNGKLRHECVNAYWFTSLADAWIRLVDWCREYDYERPHSALSGVPSAA